MRLRLAGIGAVVVALAVSQIGAAAPERDQLIRMHEGIGKVRLGMTIPQVRRALGGRHQIVYQRNDLGRNGRYVELGWERPGRTWSEPIVWRVGFRSRVGFLSRTRRGTFRVVRVITNARSQRTPEGIGVGSRPRQIAKAYREATCDFRWGIPHPGAWVIVNGPRGMTAFRIAEAQAPRARRTPMFVVATMIQQMWFSKGPQHESCGFGWEDW
jgi:hypothetical protein